VNGWDATLLGSIRDVVALFQTKHGHALSCATRLMKPSACDCGHDAAVELLKRLESMLGRADTVLIQETHVLAQETHDAVHEILVTARELKLSLKDLSENVDGLYGALDDVRREARRA